MLRSPLGDLYKTDDCQLCFPACKGQMETNERKKSYFTFGGSKAVDVGQSENLEYYEMDQCCFFTTVLGHSPDQGNIWICLIGWIG